MGGIKIELLGIALILESIALSLNNAAAFYIGALGLALVFGGCFWKDSRK